MRHEIPVTALRHIRAGLQRARLAAIICAGILAAQAADHDIDVALTLRHCVSSELFRQIKRLNRLIVEAGAP